MSINEIENTINYIFILLLMLYIIHNHKHNMNTLILLSKLWQLTTKMNSILLYVNNLESPEHTIIQVNLLKIYHFILYYNKYLSNY